MDYVDYYKILGISKNASQDEIKKAYRKLARKHHPDLNPDDKDAQKKFQQINEANEVLSDVENRKKYDQYGKDWKHADQFEKSRQSQGHGGFGGGQPFGGGQGFSNFDEQGGFSDFFQNMFGGSQGSRRSHAKFRGQDYSAEMQLPLREAFQTNKQTITVNGKQLRVTIPAGVADGQKLKLKGHGGEGAGGGPHGDLVITFKILDDPDFSRLGNDLYSTINLDIYTAMLGGEVTVNTLDGMVKVKVNHETQNGTKTKLKGKGFPVYKNDGQIGDLFITYNIQIPTNLTEEQKELVRKLAGK